MSFRSCVFLRASICAFAICILALGCEQSVPAYGPLISPTPTSASAISVPKHIEFTHDAEPSWAPDEQALLSLTRRFLDAYFDRPRPLSPSEFIHLYKLAQTGKLREPILDYADLGSGLDAVLNSSHAERVFGSTLLAETAHGVRYNACHWIGKRRIASMESHDYQMLAFLGGLGIPAEMTVILNARSFRVQDIVNDMLANSAVLPRDPAWFAMALAHYTNQSSVWLDKFNAPHNLDEIAESLLTLDLGRVSCGGAHVLEALAIFEGCPVSVSVATRLRRKNREYLNILVAHQRSDGAWNADWVDPQPVGGSVSSFLVSAHLAAFLLDRRSSIAIPTEVLTSAGSFLWAAMSGCATHDLRNLGLCPVTHAVTFLHKLLHS